MQFSNSLYLQELAMPYVEIKNGDFSRYNWLEGEGLRIASVLVGLNLSDYYLMLKDQT